MISGVNQSRYQAKSPKCGCPTRWAVLLDHLEIAWDYEPEGFLLSSGRYLPDFLLRLPQPVWLEIKPADDAVGRGERRWADLVRGTQRHLLAAFGTVRDGDEGIRLVGAERTASNLPAPTAVAPHDIFHGNPGGD
jgi:hypothetical protein